MGINKKAIQELAKIDRQLLHGILSRVRNLVEYDHVHTHEDMVKTLENIATPEKWDYIGLCSKEEKSNKELLEYLLNDSAKDIVKHKWIKPIKD